MTLIDGKKLAETITAEVTQHIVDDGVSPQLAVILVGDDPASHLYVKLKKEAAARAGIELHTYLLAGDVPEAEVLATIDFLNKDADVDAMLIQLPLPKKFDTQKILDAMDYRKDVDGFHAKNIKRLLAGKEQHIMPGLALAIWTLIASTTAENYLNKTALIISKSDEFAIPLQIILERQTITATIAKPSDPHLKKLAAAADILISAIGKPCSITADMVKQGGIVIDVGISKEKGKTVGDVDFANVAPKTSFITPVPGGVGPMTVAMLLYNTWLLSKERHSTNS